MNFGKQTIGAILSSSAYRHPDKVAVIDGEKRVTFKELDSYADRLACSFLDMGVQKGDRVAILFHNSLEFVCSYFAAVRLGAVATPLNWRMAGPELTYSLNLTGPKILIYGGTFANTVKSMRPNLETVETYVHAGENRPVWSLDFSELIEKHPAGSRPSFGWEVREEDDLDIMFTGGTTGFPKGVVIRHGSVAWNCAAEQMCIGLNFDDVIINVPPMFHIATMHDLFLTGVLVGATNVLMPAFDPVKFLELVQEHKVTAGLMVPAMSFALVNLPVLDRYDRSSLRYYITASAPLPTVLEEKITGCFPHSELVEELGATESNFITILRGHERKERRGSCGKPGFCVQIKVVDPKSGAELPAGRTGELVVWSPYNMRCYWNNEEATRQAQWGSGWYRTGDAGCMDEDGYVYIKDRIKDMIISGGENVYAAEVENVLNRHPKIAEAAVIGTPDERWGEIITAVVSLRPGEVLTLEDVKEFCKGQIAGYKIPKIMHVIDRLPRTGFMKIDKPSLRARFTAKI